MTGLRSWVDANRRTLSVISGGLLSLVPWMQARAWRAGGRERGAGLPWLLAVLVLDCRAVANLGQTTWFHTASPTAHARLHRHPH